MHEIRTWLARQSKRNWLQFGALVVLFGAIEGAIIIDGNYHPRRAAFVLGVIAIGSTLTVAANLSFVWQKRS